MTTWEKMIDKSLKNFQEEQKNTQAEAIKNRSGNRKLIENQNNEKQEIEGNSELLFINNCKNCEFTVKGRAVKVIIEGCEELHVTNNASLISGVYEIVHCNGIYITSDNPIPTIQIDMSEKISISYEKQEQFEQFFISQCKGVKLIFGKDEPYNVPCDPGDLKDWEWEDVQFRTHFKDDKKTEIFTEPVIRSDRGYILPNKEEREKEIEKMEDLLQKSEEDLVRVEKLRDSGTKGLDETIKERKETIQQLRIAIDSKKQELDRQIENIKLTETLEETNHTNHKTHEDKLDEKNEEKK